MLQTLWRVAEDDGDAVVVRAEGALLRREQVHRAVLLRRPRAVRLGEGVEAHVLAAVGIAVRGAPRNEPVYRYLTSMNSCLALPVADSAGELSPAGALDADERALCVDALGEVLVGAEVVAPDQPAEGVRHVAVLLLDAVHDRAVAPGHDLECMRDSGQMLTFSCDLFRLTFPPLG